MVFSIKDVRINLWLISASILSISLHQPINIYILRS